MKYIPRPVDTSKIELPPEITGLMERLAKNTHEVWAEGRIAEGWTFGETLDEGKKTHPYLIAYEELPESEKQYDRKTAEEALKLIAYYGYRFIKASSNK